MCLTLIFGVYASNAATLGKWKAKSIDSVLLTGVTYGNGVLTVVGYGSKTWTSKNGSQWTKGPGWSAITINFQGLTYANSVFEAPAEVTTSGYYPFEMFTSTDGKNWSVTQSSNLPGYPFYNISWCNGAFISISTDGYYWTSNDGYNWGLDFYYSPIFFADMAYGNGLYVGISGGTLWAAANISDFGKQPIHTNIKQPKLAISAVFNGWYYAASFPYALRAVIFANNMFLAVGDEGSIFTSSDGTFWQSEFVRTNNGFKAIAYGGGYYVAVGDSGTIAVSADGFNWTLETPVTSNDLYAVTYGNGVFVAVGANGTVVTCKESSK